MPILPGGIISLVTSRIVFIIHVRVIRIERDGGDGGDRTGLRQMWSLTLSSNEVYRDMYSEGLEVHGYCEDFL